MALRKKTFSARVDSAVADKLRVIGKVTKSSEAKLVEKGLEMVLQAADNDKMRLRQQLLAQYEEADRLLDSTWAVDEGPSGEVEPAQPVDEVPAGDTMLQGKVDLGVAQRLQAVARAQRRNDSGLVRHGLKLVIDEADANMRVYLKKLERDHEADVAALKAPVGRDPKVRIPPRAEEVEAGPVATTNTPKPADLVHVAAAKTAQTTDGAAPTDAKKSSTQPGP